MPNNRFIKVFDDIAGYPIAVNISNIIAVAKLEDGRAWLFLREPLRRYYHMKKMWWVFCKDNYNDVVSALNEQENEK